MEENIEQDKPNYVSYKKVLLFGSESSGKTSFVERIKTGEFKENITHTPNGNYNLK